MNAFVVRLEVFDFDFSSIDNFVFIKNFTFVNNIVRAFYWVFNERNPLDDYFTQTMYMIVVRVKMFADRKFVHERFIHEQRTHSLFG